MKETPDQYKAHLIKTFPDNCLTSNSCQFGYQCYGCPFNKLKSLAPINNTYG